MLIVTIIILVMLATISINMVINGKLIGNTREARELHENSASEEEKESENAIRTTPTEKTTVTATLTPTPMPTPVQGHSDNILPETARPQVSDGMTRVKYDSTNSQWVKVENDITPWYNYDTNECQGIEAKSWANVVLPADGSTEESLFNNGVLDETKNYVQLVWIPRYAYKITSGYHYKATNGGDISVDFIGVDNKNKAGNVTYTETYPSVTDEGKTTGAMEDYVIHPAFIFGTDNLGGFWIGKFESSTNASSAKGEYAASETMRAKPDATSRRNIAINDMFDYCMLMNKEGNAYGLNTTKTDPHLCKNDEWGAVAYLSQSSYGKSSGDVEVWINNNKNYLTGQAGDSASASWTDLTNKYKTINGIKASTTRNATGVYDMSGGSWEYVAAYLSGASKGNLTSSDTMYDKYRNVYTGYVKPTTANKQYGDAVYETSSSSSGSNGWYRDYSGFPNSDYPFFGRGGRYDYATGTGAFYVVRDDGGASSSGGFRVVMPVLNQP